MKVKQILVLSSLLALAGTSNYALSENPNDESEKVQEHIEEVSQESLAKSSNISGLKYRGTRIIGKNMTLVCEYHDKKGTRIFVPERNFSDKCPEYLESL